MNRPEYLENSSQQPTRRRESGQIVVEYVLLLVIGVGVATVITSQMVSRNANNPGFLIAKWVAILQTIGGDTPDDLAAQTK